MTSIPPEDRSPADRLLVPAGLLTVLVGALPVGIELWARTGFAEVRDALWLAGVLAFAVAFLLGTRGGSTPFRCLLFVVLQTVLALGTAVAKPWEFAGILLVVAAAQYGTLLKLPHSLLVCVGQTAALTTILIAHGREPARAAIGMAMLFMFQVFALLTANVAARESEGRIALAKVNAELVEAQGRLALASREAERLRIARDLHDVLGHRLTGLTLALETSRHLLARGETAPAAEQVERASTAARALLADVRQVVSSLREDDDGPVDLAPALRALAARFEGLQVALALPEPLLLPGPQAEALLRVAQEALTNAARHAGARNVALAISVSAGTLSLSARDDGKGGAGFVPGNGLRGMEERLEALGGSLVVSPEGGPGLCLEARIPLPVEGTL